MDSLEMVRRGIFGLAAADAAGVPAEFRSRAELKQHPITDMIGHGTHNQEAGTWSDDSSMALCLAFSLGEKHGFDPEDVMRRFVEWFQEGKYTPHGVCFDYGITVSAALRRYESGVPALKCGGNGEYDNGNGSLMRILPLLFPLVKRYGDRLWESDEAMELVHDASALTHAHLMSQSACGVYLCIAAQLMAGCAIPDAIRIGARGALEWYNKHGSPAAEQYWSCFAEPDSFAGCPEDRIESSGFVKHTLQAALWCMLNTSSYRECVLKAVNLGSDTDTVAAVAGGLAGLAYGFGDNGIPDAWMDKLQAKKMLEAACAGLA